MPLLNSHNVSIFIATATVNRGNAVDVLKETAEKLLASEEGICCMGYICCLIRKYDQGEGTDVKLS
jgi:hypothetical protein